MQITRLAASLAAVLITASLLAGVRIGFRGTPMMSVSSSRVPSPATAGTVRSEQARADSRSSAGSAITMPYYSYGASLPTLLKD